MIVLEQSYKEVACVAWHFSSDKPVYIQIAERIERSVLSGEYPPGQQIPTVRQLALEAAVNPNTVQHAFTELESKGILISHGTLGRYVTGDTAVLEACRQRMAKRVIDQLIRDLAVLSISTEQAIKMMKEGTK